MVLKNTVVGTAPVGTLSADAAGELDVLRHNGNPLGVDGAQVGVYERKERNRTLEGKLTT